VTNVGGVKMFAWFLNISPKPLAPANCLRVAVHNRVENKDDSFLAFIKR